jgi:monoterpene epsilon-lactone hydrolase
MLPRSHGNPAEWSGTGGQPSSLYAAMVYYIFNAVFWTLVHICNNQPRVAIEKIFAACKRFQSKSLTVIRQPVLALISPPTANIHYIHRGRSGSLNDTNPLIYSVIPHNKHTISREILYIHGGGCISGDFAGYKGFCEHLANKLGMHVHFVAYRLAPEADIDTAVEDVIYAHNMISAITAADICWMADSGGAVIALNAISKLLCKKQAIYIPSKCILLSPVTDLTCSNESFRRNAQADVILDAGVTRWVLWLAGRDSSKDHSPIAQLFPNCTDYKKRPEFHIYVGENEILVDDSIQMTNKLTKAGYNVNLEITPWGFHSWPLFWKYIPEAEQTVREICTIISIGATQI